VTLKRNCDGSVFDVAVIVNTSPTSTSDQVTVKSVMTKPVVFMLSMLYAVMTGVMRVTGRLPARRKGIIMGYRN